MDLYPPTHVQLKSSNIIFLGHVAFECHANFQINWKSLAHRDRQKNCLGYVAPKPWRWQMSSFGLLVGSIINQSRAHSHIWNNPKIINFVEPTLSTWQSIVDLNINKRSSWNNQETIWTGVKGIRANCSQPNYDCIGHQGLTFGKYRDVAMDGFLICFIKFPYEKVVRAWIISWVECWI